MSSSSILNRTLRRLRQAWSDINSNLRGNDRYRFDPSLSDKDVDIARQMIAECLSAPGGEWARRAQAAYIGHAYMSLNQQGRLRFLQMLAQDFDTNDVAIRQAIDIYLQSVGTDGEAKSRHKLSRLLIAPRVQLLTLFNAMPNGIKFLVDMRGELLSKEVNKNPALKEVEKDLKHLLASWFDIGFLQLQQLTWDSPASLLEKLMEYEAVHEFSGWLDLKNRLASDRRLFAFIHPNMEDEPLIFVQVALCDGLAGNVQVLLDTNARLYDTENANTAIFYSISNAQKGLSGISFGNFLIKRVVTELKKELPQLKQFATLSPVPGFSAWLADSVFPCESNWLMHDELQVIAELAQQVSVESSLSALLAVPAWHQNVLLSKGLQPILMRLCAEYLCSSHTEKVRVRDGVAHFHLGNGATLRQMHWMADVSAKGMRQSYGMMVNYLYDPQTIDTNSENYVQTGSVAISADIGHLRKMKH